jgi:hypothetical protein
MRLSYCVNVLLLFAITCSAQAAAPGPNFQHLEHLEHMIGRWNYEGKDSQGRVVRGSEENRWMHNKNFVRVAGTWRSEGMDVISYVLFIGWDAVQQKEVLNGTLSNGAIFHRVGSYDEAKNATISKETSVLPDGTTNSSICTLKFGDNPDSWCGVWTDCVEGGESVGDTHITFARVSSAEESADSPPATDKQKTVSKEEFAEYCTAMQGRWYNENELLADWIDLGNVGRGEKTVSYGMISPTADGKGLSGDFFAGKGSGKWLTVWNPVTQQLQILSVVSDGTVWEEIRYKKGEDWQCEVTLNHPDGSQETIRSVLTISRDGNTHSYRNADHDEDTGVYKRLAR